jgi:glycosyltransferase involved in cell wall biosynthesis
MKIVWVAHDHGLNAGAELCLWEGVKGLVGAGHDLRVVVPSSGRLTERLLENGIPASVFPYRWWVHSGFRLPFRRLVSHLRAAAKVEEFLGQARPDVVITNTLTIPVGALAAHRARIPHVWYVHEFGREDHGLKFDFGTHLSLAMIRGLSRKVIVNSLAVREKFRRFIPESRLRVLYYAVDVPGCAASEPVPDDPFRLILVGRICEGKRQEDAVRAVAWLAGRGHHTRLTLLGNENADYGKYLRGLVRDLGADGLIEFMPFAQDPHVHLTRSHAALVCSKCEAFGRVTIEAMKQGKPVIGARAGATGELIHDGVTGLLYQPMDHADLGQKIASLDRNRPLLIEMGSNALNWAIRNFNLETHTAGLVAILKEAAAS